ncbi:MAG: type 4a pilus biogenesis protein PilO [Candidatus Omnitrophica bacterium]|nr:type 4a pilus biogenesis protein PilO [Candidatus Omnitrophota bacterium]
MDLKQLKQIQLDDFKDMDPLFLKEFVRRRPDIIVNVLVTIATIIICINFSTGPKQEIQGIKVKISEGKSKLDLVNQIKSSEKKQSDIKGSFPKACDSDQLTALISSIALKNGIEISSLSPGQKADSTYHYFYSMRIEVTAARYKNLGEFIKGLENTEFAIMVDDINVMPVNYENKSKENSSFIRAQVSIKTIVLKNE